MRSRDFSVVSIDAPVLAEQQEEADTLFRHGHFDRAVAIGRPLQATK